jgi:hypothetical protein
MGKAGPLGPAFFTGAIACICYLSDTSTLSKLQISPTYLKEIGTIKTCDINISDSLRRGGAFCHLTQLLTQLKNRDILSKSQP